MINVLVLEVVWSKSWRFQCPEFSLLGEFHYNYIPMSLTWLIFWFWYAQTGYMPVRIWLADSDDDLDTGVVLYFCCGCRFFHFFPFFYWLPLSPRYHLGWWVWVCCQQKRQWEVAKGRDVARACLEVVVSKLRFWIVGEGYSAPLPDDAPDFSIGGHCVTVYDCCHCHHFPSMTRIGLLGACWLPQPDNFPNPMLIIEDATSS